MALHKLRGRKSMAVACIAVIGLLVGVWAVSGGSPAGVARLAAPGTGTGPVPAPGSGSSPAAPGGSSTGAVDRAQYIVPDTTGGPSSSAADPSGNFRFLCYFSHLAADDPIVFPGRPGASHLHMFFGNASADASSTYASLRASGSSTCAGGPLNRSAYWIPAMFDAGEKVVIPDYITVYYKGNGPSAAQIRDIRVFPEGLKMIAGYDMARPGQDTHFAWDCEKGGVSSQTIPSCPAGQRVGVRLIFPTCWDGANLDSADHRDHMAYGSNVAGVWSCPAGHPVLLPEYQIGVWFANDGDSANWHLASDRMPGKTTYPNGSSFHADWFGGWDPLTMKTWVSKCIDALKNCGDGELGDGTSLSSPTTYDGPMKVVAPG